MFRRNVVMGACAGAVLLSVFPVAQAPPAAPRPAAPAPWRFAGARPCAGPEGGVVQRSCSARESPTSDLKRRSGFPPEPR